MKAPSLSEWLLWRTVFPDVGPLGGVFVASKIDFSPRGYHFVYTILSNFQEAHDTSPPSSPAATVQLFIFE
jgi:hypothetical protein